MCIYFRMWVAYSSSWLFTVHLKYCIHIYIYFRDQIKTTIGSSISISFHSNNINFMLTVQCSMFKGNTQKMEYYTSRLFVRGMFYFNVSLLQINIKGRGLKKLENKHKYRIDFVISRVTTDDGCNNGWKSILYSFSNRIALTEIFQKMNCFKWDFHILKTEIVQCTSFYHFSHRWM